MGTTSTGSTGALVLGTGTGLNRVLSFPALFPPCVPATGFLGLSPEGSFQIHLSWKQFAKDTGETYTGPCRYKDELTQNNDNMPN